MQTLLRHHPQFILENLRDCWELFLEDQTFRYLELRKRLQLELKITLEPEHLGETNRQRLQSLKTILSDSDSDLSWIEQALLAESHERFRHLKLLLELDRITQINRTTDRYEEAALKRLHEIHHELSVMDLGRNPHWIKVLRFRWILEPLRREAQYLAKILDQNIYL